LDEKLQGINHCGLDAVKKKEIEESLSFLYENETKDKEKNNSDMASEMSDPGDRPVQQGRAPPTIYPLHEFQFPGHWIRQVKVKFRFC